MIKPASLRAALTAACPRLATNPESLHVFVEEGNLRSTMAGGLSCEYNYTLTLLVTDYADSPDLLMIPLLAWLRRHQPDMLENYDKQRHNISFQVDFLDHEKCDVEIKLKDLTERVIVRLSEARDQGLADGSLADGNHADGSSGNPGDSPSADSPAGSIPIPDGMIGPAAVADIIHVAEPPTDPYEEITRWRFWIEDVPESFREWDVNPLPGQQHLQKGLADGAGDKPCP